MEFLWGHLAGERLVEDFLKGFFGRKLPKEHLLGGPRSYDNLYSTYTAAVTYELQVGCF